MIEVIRILGRKTKGEAEEEFQDSLLKKIIVKPKSDQKHTKSTYPKPQKSIFCLVSPFSCSTIDSSQFPFIISL